MVELGTAAAVYGLITGTIGIINTSIQIYKAVQDKSGITEGLRKVSEKLPSIKDLLEDAAEQYKSKNIDEQVWLSVGADIQHCNAACKELQEILERAYPRDSASPAGRVFKNLGNIVSGRGKKAEDLLKEICQYLDLLGQRQIITNTRLLEELKQTVNELFPTSGVIQHNVNGPNIARDQNFTGGNGPMFNGPIGTYNATGVPDELNEELWTRKLLQWLHFEQINDREFEIKSPHKATFGWALQPRQDPKSTGPNLAEWLQNRDGLFWVQGKLGSGKSTLMKYVCQSASLQEYLRIWADGEPLHCASFFFWKKDASEMQRSLQGLYRSLLFHLITSDKALARVAFPFWQIDNKKSYEPTAPALQNALSRILKHSSSSRSHKYCFFIDGLDEYEEKSPGLQIELAQDILRMADIPGVKIVAASRPEASFMNRFVKCPTLCLPDHTANDIKAYVAAEIRSEMVPRHSTDDETSKLILADEIVQRADGVFLWVALVVADLVIGMDQTESHLELLERLGRLHDDLNDLFKQILLDRIMPEHRQQVARNLLMASSHSGSPFLARRDLRVHAVGQSVETTSDSVRPDPCDVKETVRKSKHLATCLSTRTRGLCSVDIKANSLTLIHSSMHDFLVSQDIQDLLQEQAGQFSVFLAFAIGTMAYMAVRSHDDPNFWLHSDKPDFLDAMTGSIEMDMRHSGVPSQYAITCLERLVESRDTYCSPTRRMRDRIFGGSIGRGCTHYIHHQLERKRGITWAHECPLLFEPLLYYEPEDYDTLLDTGMISRAGVKRDEIIELLLQNGADPNEIHEGTTPWKVTLRLVRKGFLQRSLLTSAKHMLHHGADPDFHDVHSGISTQVFADLLNGNCHLSNKMTECPCAGARHSRPVLLDLVKLVKQKRLEKQLQSLVQMSRLGVREPAGLPTSMDFLITLVTGSLELVHSRRAGG